MQITPGSLPREWFRSQWHPVPYQPLFPQAEGLGEGSNTKEEQPDEYPLFLSFPLRGKGRLFYAVDLHATEHHFSCSMVRRLKAGI